MKDDLAFRQSKRLGHTRQHWNLMTALSEWAISDAGGHDKVFGTKPKTAEYRPTDLGEEAGRAVQQNLDNYPEIQKLLDTILPGYSDMLKSGSKSAQQLLRGEIPEDVQKSVMRTGAFQALMGGYGGSAMSKALTARDLGRTSLDMMERGQNSAQRWAALASGASAPYMVTAPAAAEASFLNKQLAQATEQRKYNVEAAPDPGAAGQFNLQVALGSMAASFGMSSALSGMGGGQAPAGGSTGSAASGIAQGAQQLGTMSGGANNFGNLQSANAPTGNNYAYAPPPSTYGNTGNNPWGPTWAGSGGWG